MEHCYRLGAESVMGKVALRDWHALQFDTQPGISQPVQDVPDADGVEVLAPSKAALNLGGTRVTLLRNSS